MVSATMSRAPARASSTVGTSSVRNDAANSSGVTPVARLGQDQVRQRLQSAFARDHGPGAAFGLVGLVEVFQLGAGGGGVDRGFQLRREQPCSPMDARMVTRRSSSARKARQQIDDVANLLFIQAAGRLLAIAGNEG